MNQQLHCGIEYRADDHGTSPGRIVGTLLTYGERALDRPEVFLDGSLQWPDGGLILNVQHQRSEPIIRFTPSVQDRAVLIDVDLPDTTRGRDVAVMVRNGTLRGLSVEFRSLSEGRRCGLREIRSARLLGAAVVDSPSHKTSVELRYGGHAPHAGFSGCGF